VPFAVLAPGGQSENFWIPPRMGRNGILNEISVNIFVTNSSNIQQQQTTRGPYDALAQTAHTDRIFCRVT